MTLKNLPIGIQTFAKIREDNFVYIDKTAQILDLANKQGAFFLSRPRRFGKSLLIKTVKSSIVTLLGVLKILFNKPR
jgi:hypothetical protein